MVLTSRCCRLMFVFSVYHLNFRRCSEFQSLTIVILHCSRNQSIIEYRRETIPPPAPKITLKKIRLSPRTAYNPSRRTSLVVSTSQQPSGIAKTKHYLSKGNKSIFSGTARSYAPILTGQVSHS